MRRGKKQNHYQKLMMDAPPEVQDSCLIFSYIKMAGSDGWSHLENVRNILKSEKKLDDYHIHWLCNAITEAQRDPKKLLQYLQLKQTAGNPEKTKWWDKPKYLWGCYLEKLTDEGMETSQAIKEAQKKWFDLYRIEAPDISTWDKWSSAYRNDESELTGAIKRNDVDRQKKIRNDMSAYSTGAKTLKTTRIKRSNST